MRSNAPSQPGRATSSEGVRAFLRFTGQRFLCRGCLGPLGAEAEAGLCGTCWAGLVELPEPRCPRCALSHGEGECQEPLVWSLGDAFWDYHGGRPPFGALVLPGIKAGELGWRKALLARAERCDLPKFAWEADLVTAAPTARHRRWLRGFDLAEDAARQVAGRLALPFLRTLGKKGRKQAVLPESARRALPRHSIRLLRSALVEGRTILLVDDVWTTGTTLLRSAQALLGGGAAEVRILTLFRAT